MYESDDEDGRLYRADGDIENGHFQVDLHPNDASPQGIGCMLFEI